MASIQTYSRKFRKHTLDVLDAQLDRPTKLLKTAMASTERNNAVLDCLIIGGGPAGLSVATALARQLYQVVLFDGGKYGNDRATHMHNVATWDHHPPSEFRQAARKNILERYNTVHFEDTEVESVERTSTGHFEAKDAGGRTWIGKKLVLATGSRAVFPDITGYADCWGTGM